MTIYAKQKQPSSGFGSNQTSNVSSFSNQSTGNNNDNEIKKATTSRFPYVENGSMIEDDQCSFAEGHSSIESGSLFTGDQEHASFLFPKHVVSSAGIDHTESFPDEYSIGSAALRGYSAFDGDGKLKPQLLSSPGRIGDVVIVTKTNGRVTVEDRKHKRPKQMSLLVRLGLTLAILLMLLSLLGIFVHLSKTENSKSSEDQSSSSLTNEERDIFLKQKLNRTSDDNRATRPPTNQPTPSPSNVPVFLPVTTVAPLKPPSEAPTIPAVIPTEEPTLPTKTGKKSNRSNMPTTSPKQSLFPSVFEHVASSEDARKVKPKPPPVSIRSTGSPATSNRATNWPVSSSPTQNGSKKNKGKKAKDNDDDDDDDESY